MVVSPLERKRVAKNPGAGQAPGQRADDVEGVDFDTFSVEALGELAAGRTVEHEFEWLTVDPSPLGDDVGDGYPQHRGVCGWRIVTRNFVAVEGGVRDYGFVHCHAASRTR